MPAIVYNRILLLASFAGVPKIKEAYERTEIEQNLDKYRIAESFEAQGFVDVYYMWKKHNRYWWTKGYIGQTGPYGK